MCEVHRKARPTSAEWGYIIVGDAYIGECPALRCRSMEQARSLPYFFIHTSLTFLKCNMRLSIFRISLG